MKPKTSPGAPDSMLELRRVEAAIVKDVYDVVLKRHGRTEAEEIVGQAIAKSARAQGAAMRKNLGHEPDLEDFADLIPLWEADDALEVEVLHRDAHRLDFNVRRCRFSEMYREMGMAELGHLLSCNRDAEFCVGYNSEMKLKRSQTIMQGAAFCDFRYRLKNQD